MCNTWFYTCRRQSCNKLLLTIKDECPDKGEHLPEFDSIRSREFCSACEQEWGVATSKNVAASEEGGGGMKEKDGKQTASKDAKD